MIRFNNKNDMIKKAEKQQLNKRQDYIITILEKGNILSVGKLLEWVNKDVKLVSKITINRDLNKLLKIGLIVTQGEARTTVYSLSPHYKIIQSIDPEKYFQIKSDERSIKDRFDFSIFPVLKNIFTSEDQEFLEELNKQYKVNLKGFSPASLKQEYERLIIEFSWKSSEIEGNTYTLLETEALIKNKKVASGHKAEEATMILNHKVAFDYIRNNLNKFQKISLREIENVHHLLTQGLEIKKGLRSTPVGIVGTKYKPLDNIHQIQEAVEKMVNVVNNETDLFSKTIIFMALMAYIQPFEDGNKRTSRLVGNAILMAHDSCPLSYRSVNEMEYKKAVILFYEQSNISYFKKLFIEQFQFALKNYFC